MVIHARLSNAHTQNEARGMTGVSGVKHGEPGDVNGGDLEILACVLTVLRCYGGVQNTSFM